MAKRADEPIRIEEAVARALAPDISPKVSKRVARTVCTRIAHYLHEGHAVLLPEVGVLRIHVPEPKRVRSNLPHLRGNVYHVRRRRGQLKVDPRGRTATTLRQQASYFPPGWRPADRSGDGPRARTEGSGPRRAAAAERSSPRD